MRVTFDDGFQAPPAGQEREIVPDGEHNVTIHKVTDDGKQLTVILAPNGHFRLVYLDLKNDQKGQAKAAALAAALGMSARDWAGCQPEDLVGRRLRIQTRQWVGNDSKTRVNVDKLLPPDPPDAAPEPAQAPPVIRTPAAKVAQARGDEPGGEDDIPFLWLLPFVLAVMAAGGMA